MSKKKSNGNNLKLAGIFIALVIGLILMSFALKLIIIVKSSKFDGNHKLNVLIKASNNQVIASFSPNPRGISIIKLPNDQNNSASVLDVPIDGLISIKGDLNTKDLFPVFFKSLLPFGQKTEKLTFLDLLRLSLFTRTIPSGSTNEREYVDSLSKTQKDTLISLTFNDPTIYEENQSIQIINSTGVNGIGSRMATFISNLGGNPILVSTSGNIEKKSKIIYYKDESYTIKRLSSYFDLIKEKTDNKGIADVTIIIGEDLIKDKDF